MRKYHIGAQLPLHPQARLGPALVCVALHPDDAQPADLSERIEPSVDQGVPRGVQLERLHRERRISLAVGSSQLEVGQTDSEPRQHLSSSVDLLDTAEFGAPPRIA